MEEHVFNPIGIYDESFTHSHWLLQQFIEKFHTYNDLCGWTGHKNWNSTVVMSILAPQYKRTRIHVVYIGKSDHLVDCLKMDSINITYSNG